MKFSEMEYSSPTVTLFYRNEILRIFRVILFSQKSNAEKQFLRAQHFLGRIIQRIWNWKRKDLLVRHRCANLENYGLCRLFSRRPMVVFIRLLRGYYLLFQPNEGQLFSHSNLMGSKVIYPRIVSATHIWETTKTIPPWYLSVISCDAGI